MDGTDPSLPPQGYRLDISGDRVRAWSSDAAGASYARATLAQLARLHDGRLPVGSVEDWPDLAVRGVMLDISRDKVPTMATLETLVSRFASWKINQLQLYTEHTFAYRDHGEVWADASPLTADEVRHLDRYCRRHHVELVPNQNTLGHMERWLRHPRYRSLAIAPGGYGDARRPPTTLDPAKPASLALVRELLGELVGNFSSRRVHVGLDEPWELPPERAGDYLGWVRSLRDLHEVDGRELLVWGDVLALHPELLARLPDGVTVCEWGYEDWHPFSERAATLASAARPFWVCPGTSSWLSLLGRWSNMVGNCRAAAAAATAHGAAGLLQTDWGDLGHLQYLPVSEPGFAWAAAVSWCAEANRDLDLAAALDEHAFCDQGHAVGGALRDLGDLHRRITPQFPNLSTLVAHLYHPQAELGRSLTEGLTVEELAEAESVLDEVSARLGRARPSRPDGSLVLDELRTAIALVSVLCRDARARLEGDGRLESVPPIIRRRLAAELDPVIAAHHDLWMARNRPGGFSDSVGWLERLRGSLAG